jgi:uncharacterized iron-regulated membrane protein
MLKSKMAGKKLIGKIHRWLGLLSGLVVFILGITGCLYAFIDEIKPLVYRDRMFVEVPAGAKRLPLDVLQVHAQQAVGEGHQVQVAEVSTAANRTVSFRSIKTNPEAFGYNKYMEYYYHIFMNPYTGQVIKVENTKWEFFQVVISVHVSLLLGLKVGEQIIRWSVVIFVLLLISGLILWWPKNKAAAKQRFAFKWKESTKWKRKNYDLHNILGFYTMIILLVISVTGLIWCFEWLRNSVQWTANGGKTIAAAEEMVSDTTNTTAFSMENIYRVAVKNDPQATTIFISPPDDHKSVIYVYARNDDAPYFKDAEVQYDQHSTAQLKRTTFATMNNGEKTYALNYDLHVGSILDYPVKCWPFLHP